MARRSDGSGRVTPPRSTQPTGRVTPPRSEPYRDPLRPTRPAWVRWVVFAMVGALLLSVVATFFSALV